MADIKTLGSDEFEGRAPGTSGEEKTIAWLEKQFRDAGLKPGNPDGTYLQNVPLSGSVSTTKESITINGKPVKMTPHKDFVAGSTRYAEKVEVKDSPIVFVGYGVVAPEYNWNDYKDFDVKGKTIIMLVNDPAIPDPADATKLDDKMFKGRAMTYYGRWTYKYEIATEKGAAAAIIVHETGPAGYPFAVVQGSPDEEKFGIQRPDNNMGRVPVEVWIAYEKAAELMKAAGLDLADLKKQALSRDFKPVELKGGRASFSVENKLRKINSHNVVAKLEGSDARLKDEYVIYTAHWDHLGRDNSLKGDQIFQRRTRQRIRYRGIAGSGAGLSETAGRPQTFHSFSGRYGGRERLAGFGLLREQSSLSAEQNACRYQYGRGQRLRQDQRPHHNWPRQLYPG